MFGTPVREFFSVEMMHAVDRIACECGYNALNSPDLWESWIAGQLGGDRTPKKHPFDVSVEIWGRRLAAEVKFSTAFHGEFTPIRGKSVSRTVFKWVMTKGQVRHRPADAVIFIGLDIDQMIYSWVVPTGELPNGKRSFTITAPSSRRSGVGRMDRWEVPATEILPAFATACHNTYDLPHRRANAGKTNRAKKAAADLFEVKP